MSGVIDRAINVQTVTLADYEIVVAVTRRRMHCAGTRLTRCLLVARFAYIQLGFRICLAAQRDVFAHHQKRRTIDPGMATLKTIQFRANETGEYFRFDPVSGFVPLSQIALLGDRLEQFRRNYVNFVAVFKSRVFVIRMDCYAEIRR